MERLVARSCKIDKKLHSGAVHSLGDDGCDLLGP
jgi:hypothetical protein